MIGKLKALLVQKKHYLVAVMTAVAALVAFSEGQLSPLELGAVISGVLLLMTKKAGDNRREQALQNIADGIEKGQVNTGVVLEELVERLSG